MRMPILASERVLVRPFVAADLDAVYELLDVQLAEADVGTEGALSRTERERWLQWAVLNEEALAHLKQAAVRRSGGGPQGDGLDRRRVRLRAVFRTVRAATVGRRRGRNGPVLDRVWALLRHLAGLSGPGPPRRRPRACWSATASTS